MEDHPVDPAALPVRPVDVSPPSTAVIDAHVFHATVRENLALVRSTASESELAGAARRAPLPGWIAALPDGRDTNGRVK